MKAPPAPPPSPSSSPPSCAPLSPVAPAPQLLPPAPASAPMPRALMTPLIVASPLTDTMSGRVPVTRTVVPEGTVRPRNGKIAGAVVAAGITNVGVAPHQPVIEPAPLVLIVTVELQLSVVLGALT
jgi:hypothetical protein